MDVDNFISAFEISCKDNHKLFIPDSPRQEAVAKSLVEHYNNADLLKAAEMFIKSEPGPFLIFEFAIQSRTFMEKVKFESASGARFKQIVAETRKRFQEEDET